jgi:hypothetical protein
MNGDFLGEIGVINMTKTLQWMVEGRRRIIACGYCIIVYIETVESYRCTTVYVLLFCGCIAVSVTWAHPNLSVMAWVVESFLS